MCAEGIHGGPTVGEMVLAVAVQRACAPSAKRHLATFLESCLPRVSCLAASAFTGQAFHREAARVSDEQLERAQIEIARAVVRRFELSTDVLAFDTTNFDTHIATTTTGDWARRGHAQSKRSDLRVVGLAALVSETGHVPLLHRTYPGNGSDQAVLGSCLDALGQLHDALDDGQQRSRRASRTLVREGGSWSEPLELDLDVEGYYSLISLPLSHSASQWALEQAARRGAMKPVGGKLGDVRAARLRAEGGNLNRTLVVVESPELLRGQRRGIAVALRKAREELRQLEQRAAGGRIPRQALEDRVNKALQREHLADFVVATVTERGGKFRFSGTWMQRADACWSAHDWADVCCVPTAMPGAQAASYTPSAGSGILKNYSGGPRRGAWCPGDLLTSGLTVPCDCTRSRQ